MSHATYHSKAFAVLFKDLERWDPASFRDILWKWPKTIMRPIGSFLTARKEKVDRTIHSFRNLQPITIHFDGSIEKRKVPSNRDYSMDLIFARPGDIVVAKIDLKNGAVGILPDWEHAVVTGHFAVYEPDCVKIVPEYFHRLIQTNFFREHLWRNKVGAEGRKEVKLDFFEAQEIPVPPLPIQQAIVEHWRQAQGAAAKCRETASALEAQLQEGVLNLLGMKYPHKDETLPKAFALRWQDLDRWSVEYLCRKSQGINFVDRCKHHMMLLHQVAQGQSGGTPSKKNGDYWGGKIPWASPKDMKSLEIFDTEDHTTEVALEMGNVTLIPKDSILIVVRSGILQRTVPVAITRVPVAINQDMRAFSIKDDRLSPDFLLHYLSARQDALLRLVKYSTTVQSINKEELEAIPIPLPPIEVQQQIVDIVNTQRQRITEERKTAEGRLTRAKREVEEMILGIRPVGL